jgi:hypothetical protein
MTRVRDEVADVSIITGHRGEQEQNQKYAEGKSKVEWPDGKHNSFPSKAVDFQPYPLPTRTEKLWASLAYVAGRAIEIGKGMGLIVRWGGDWNGDGDMTDQNFDDLYHLEVEDPNGLYETYQSNMGRAGTGSTDNSV